MSGESGGAITLPLDVAELEALVTSNDVGLVVLDPLVSTLDDEISPNKDNELRRALEPVISMADRTGAVVVGIVHFGKTAGRDALSLVLGSRGFTAVARTVFACAKRPDADGFVMSQVKNNLGPKVPHLAYRTISATVETDDGEMSVGRTVFDGELATGVEEILLAAGDREAPRRTEAAVFLLEYLAARGGEAPAKDVVTAASAEGINRTTLTDARLAAKIKIRRAGFPASTFWQLPDFSWPTG